MIRNLLLALLTTATIFAVREKSVRLTVRFPNLSTESQVIIVGKLVNKLKEAKNIKLNSFFDRTPVVAIYASFSDNVRLALGNRIHLYFTTSSRLQCILPANTIVCMLNDKHEYVDLDTCVDEFEHLLLPYIAKQVLCDNEKSAQ